MNTTSITSIQEALKTAIDMEIKGCAFYKEVAGTYKDSLTKDIFDGLAADEVLHRKAIETYYNSIREHRGLPPLSSVLSGEPERDRSIFSRSFDELAGAIGAGTDVTEAYKTGMELEKTGYDYYEKILNTAKDREIKELFRFLLKEENQHYTLLARTYGYLTRPQDTFDDEEKPFFEG
ncbi:MAG: ferritin family protein [Candidatus Omnitrophica bacterium]|nr:ferritin family protein [Candidatus Omnitrophota bacterium]